jgi:hypothetical protein
MTRYFEDEYVCTHCREINIQEEGQDMATKPCDDCGQIGGLVALEVDDKNAERKPVIVLGRNFFVGRDYYEA